MSSIFMRLLLPAGLLLAASAVQAQVAGMSPVPPSPTVPAGESPVPPPPAGSAGASPGATGLAYRSAFTSYRAWSEQPVASWPDANRTVGQLGGWRTYARQAQQPETGGEGAGEPSSRPQPHVGHGAQP